MTLPKVIQKRLRYTLASYPNVSFSLIIQHVSNSSLSFAKGPVCKDLKEQLYGFAIGLGQEECSRSTGVLTVLATVLCTYSVLKPVRDRAGESGDPLGKDRLAQRQKC